MCGIYGYTGEIRHVWNTAARALQRLEYRGYDSWGIAWVDADTISVSKDVGRIGDANPVDATSGLAIGHTRWATHGGVTPANAHPHLDGSGRIALVHNGIVENVDDLRASLPRTTKFHSETDTEVIAHLIERELDFGCDFAEAVARVFSSLEGCNAIVAMQRGDSRLIVVKRVSPMVVGHTANGTVIASDALALADSCEEMWVLPDNVLAVCLPDGVQFAEVDSLSEIALPSEPVPVVRGVWKVEEDTHFMDLEMQQQPEVLRAIADRDPVELDAVRNQILHADEIVLTGCGSALFAARLGAQFLRAEFGKRATAVAASEIVAELPYLAPNSLVIALSQSGETADVVDAMLHVQRLGFATAGLVNVGHSTLARLVDCALLLEAGPEQCVLATKSWMAKAGLLLSLAGEVRSVRMAADAIESMLNDPDLFAQMLLLSQRLAVANTALIVGNGTSALAAQEMALKIKEASYVHAEAFAAGELKHGAIALVEPGVPCLIVGEAASTAHELHSRGGYTIGIGTGAGPGFDEVVDIPDLGSASPLAQVLIAQMLAYRTALARGVNPDRPRNLAKSVTVK